MAQRPKKIVNGVEMDVSDEDLAQMEIDRQAYEARIAAYNASPRQIEGWRLWDVLADNEKTQARGVKQTDWENFNMRGSDMMLETNAKVGRMAARIAQSDATFTVAVWFDRAGATRPPFIG